MTKEVNLKHYYTKEQAAERLSKNSDMEVPVDYLRKLTQYGNFHPLKLSPRSVLYLKAEIDPYKVEKRGVKMHRARAKKPKAIA